MSEYKLAPGYRPMTDFIENLPKPLRDQAMKHKKPNWPYLGKRDMTSALLQVKYDAPLAERAFWSGVIDYYETGAPLPSRANIPKATKSEARPEKERRNQSLMVREAIRSFGADTFDLMDIIAWGDAEGVEFSRSNVSTLLTNMRKRGEVECIEFRKPQGRKTNLYTAKKLQ